MVKLLFALFLLGHLAIHTLWFGPRPAPTPGAPAWPFDVADSTLVHVGVDVSAARFVGLMLLTGVVVGFVLAAFGALAVLPAWTFEGGVLLGATSSLAMLVAFFHPWLVLGIGIDAVLLWAALIAHWSPATLD